MQGIGRRTDIVWKGQHVGYPHQALIFNFSYSKLNLSQIQYKQMIAVL